LRRAAALVLDAQQRAVPHDALDHLRLRLHAFVPEREQDRAKVGAVHQPLVHVPCSETTTRPKSREAVSIKL
jgi:hypothetical protein